MIILDAAVLIAYANSTDSSHDKATDLLVELADHPLGTSALTMAEALVRYAALGRAEAALDGFVQLGVEVIEIPDSAPVGLAELRQRTGLRMPDCCVLFAARLRSAIGVATFDDKLGCAAAKLGHAVFGVNTASYPG